MRMLMLLLMLVACVPQNKVCFETRCLDVEIRDDAASRALGLMGRQNLTDSQGMLFVFEKPGVYPFWMKNMLIPIDMIWVTDLGYISHIEESVPPCAADPCPIYDPQAEALYVVETAAGFSSRYGLEAGQEVRLP